MKLFTFGCSMTDYEGIKERLSELLDVELINSAQSAGSNQLQVKRFHQLILENQISSNDIIYWQVTFSHRRFKRLMKHHLPVIEEIQRNSFTHEGVHFKTSKNIFDGEIRIDLMSNSPWLEDNLDEIDVDYNDELQSLLATIIIDLIGASNKLPMVLYFLLVICVLLSILKNIIDLFLYYYKTIKK